MSMSIRTVVALIALMVGAAVQVGAQAGDKTTYMGGTITGIPAKTEGIVQVTAQDMVFLAQTGQMVNIPWATVKSIEYGQRMSRHWKVGVLAPVTLLARSRNHVVSIEYEDRDGHSQAAVLEFGKDAYRRALATLSDKSGREITCQDEEARKQLGAPCRMSTDTGQVETESPRDCRRLHSLRGWSHEQSHQIFPRSAGARRPAPAGT